MSNICANIRPVFRLAIGSAPDNNRERHTDGDAAEQVACEYIPSGRLYLISIHAGIIRPREAAA